MIKVAVIGSHGLYANYGGWDQLVNNLADLKSDRIQYLIFNSADNKINSMLPSGVKVQNMKIKASGFEGIFYDFWSLLIALPKVNVFLLLGIQGMPLALLLKLLFNKKIVTNVGGVEWERPKFNLFAKLYLKFCFRLSFIFSSKVILDNEYYKAFEPKLKKTGVTVIPYGGTIDLNLTIDDNYIKKFPFLIKEYYLSISRSLKDNLLDELCESFSGSDKTLVLISNFDKSEYGEAVFNKYCKNGNIILINGLYNKPELDLVRRNCRAYIHTHTLCGTAPSLVEMIVAQRPIISIDNPQNRFTLKNEGYYFREFSEIQKVLKYNKHLDVFIPTKEVISNYHWSHIVDKYEALYQ